MKTLDEFIAFKRPRARNAFQKDSTPSCRKGNTRSLFRHLGNRVERTTVESVGNIIGLR